MDLLKLEQQRQALELSLQRLRTSLKHWQTWEAEYEGLKEETLAKEGGLTADVLTEISKSYGGELVNEREIRDLTGLAKGEPRSASQIVGVVERRQEYVKRNVEVLQRRFWDAEAKLEEMDFAVRRNGSAAGGLPLTEIHEELDVDDNVISSRLVQPEAATAEFVDGLKKAGLAVGDLAGGEDEEEEGAAAAGAETPPQSCLKESNVYAASSVLAARAECEDQVGPDRPPIRKKSVSFSADTKIMPEVVRMESEDGKKSVSFAEKVSVARAADPPDTRSVSFAPTVEEIPAEGATPASPEATTKLDPQKELRSMFKPGEKVAELDADDKLAATHWVLPENEPEEDAKIRREMLEYHLNEVGHVVAQIDLEEAAGDEMDVDDDVASASDPTFSERPDEDTPYTSGMSDDDDDEEVEDDDEFGRSKKPAFSDAYHKEMQALQQRLIGNLGPSPSEPELGAVDPEIDPQDVRRLVIREKRESSASTNSDGDKKAGGKKRVSFAEALDIAEPGSPPLKAQKTHAGENVAPVTEVVAERKTATSPSLPHLPAIASQLPASRFIPDDPDTETSPSFSPGQTLTETLHERTPTHATAPSADDPDALMQRRELAAEYYRRRNDIVRAQGGFKTPSADEVEDEGGELMEEREDGSRRKVSRFRAGRIRGGMGG